MLIMAKSDKEKKVEKSNHVASQKDQYTVVLEQLNSQFKAFGESLKGLRDKVDDGFDRVDKRLDKIDLRFDRFEIETAENFKIVKNYLSRVTDDLDRIATEIKEMKSEPEKIDFDRVAELEKEVEHLKKEINRQGKLIQMKLCA